MKSLTAILLITIWFLTISAVTSTAQTKGDLYVPKKEQQSGSASGVASEDNALVPANDNFAGAESISMGGNSVITITRSNAGASKETGEPDHARNAGGSSVWFAFTPAVTQTVRIKTTHPSTTFDTTLAVYQGSTLASLTRVGYNDDCLSSGCNTTSMVDLMLTAGVTYRIAIDGYNGGDGAASGSFVLSLTEIGTPVTYNNIEAAYDLGATGSGSIAGTNNLATGQAGEPGAYATPGGKSVWYRFQVPSIRAMTTEMAFDFPGEAAVYVSSVPNPTFAQLDRLDETAGNFSNNFGRFTIEFLGVPNQYYFLQVDYNETGGAAVAGNFQVSLYQSKLRYSARFSNYTRQSSVSVFRPSNGVWYDLRTFDLGNTIFTNFGLSSDTPVNADYNGDGSTDYAVTRDENGLKNWYFLNASKTGYNRIQWGLSTDKEVVGDFDRDGLADPTVIRSVNGNLVWYVRQSSNQNMRAFVYGLSTDRPVIGDFDGDGATEIAVARQSGNDLVWYRLMSNGSLAYANSTTQQFGLASDLPAVEDFDGDGKTDLAVYRSGTWMILRSGSGEVQVTPFGSGIDYPQPADYDGDGKAELALFRPTTGDWYFWKSADNTQKTLHWGTPGDHAVSSMARFSLPESNE